MKKLLFLLLAACAMFLSCESKDPSNQNSSNNFYNNVNFIGYKLYKVPYYGKRYKITIAGSYYSNDENWGRETIYTPVLNSSDIPYTYMFVNKVLLDNITWNDDYTIYVHWSDNGPGSGTQCLKQKVTHVSDFSTYTKKQKEYILTSDNGKTKIGVLFEYQ